MSEKNINCFNKNHYRFTACYRSKERNNKEVNKEEDKRLRSVWGSGSNKNERGGWTAMNQCVLEGAIGGYVCLECKEM